MRGVLDQIQAQPLKTAASCNKHGVRTYACVNCGESVTRKACETWHADQCDDCIIKWGYDQAIKHADKALSDGEADHIVKWHQDNVAKWRATMKERGL